MATNVKFVKANVCQLVSSIQAVTANGLHRPPADTDFQINYIQLYTASTFHCNNIMSISDPNESQENKI